jgi:hypothetical protein
MTRGLFEIVEEKWGARRRVHRSTNNELCENNNGETIEQQHGTRPHGTFSRAASALLPCPRGREGALITFCCLQIVADSSVGGREL